MKTKIFERAIIQKKLGKNGTAVKILFRICYVIFPPLIVFRSVKM